MEKRREGLGLAELGPPRLLHPEIFHPQPVSVPFFKCHIPEILLRDHYCPVGPSIQRECEDDDTRSSTSMSWKVNRTRRRNGGCLIGPQMARKAT
jgi:hypothetical protein